MFHRNNPKYTSNSISTLFKKWTSNGTGKGVYLWCHTLWKQSQTVFDVVYTWIEKNKIKEVSLYYKISPQPSLYKRRRNTLHWLPWGRKVMQVASRHHCYKNRHKRIGVFWATLQVACSKVEKTDFLFFFYLSVCELLPTHRSYCRIRLWLKLKLNTSSTVTF